MMINIKKIKKKYKSRQKWIKYERNLSLTKIDQIYELLKREELTSEQISKFIPFC